MFNARTLAIKVSKTGLKPNDILLVEVGDPKHSWIPSTEELRTVRNVLSDILTKYEALNITGIVTVANTVKISKKKNRRKHG